MIYGRTTDAMKEASDAMRAYVQAAPILDRHEDRCKVVRSGLVWSVQIGDGTQLYGRFLRKVSAMRYAADLHRAFCDGVFAACSADQTGGAA